MKVIATIQKPDAIEAICAALIAAGRILKGRLRPPRPPPLAANTGGPSVVPLPHIA